MVKVSCLVPSRAPQLTLLSDEEIQQAAALSWLVEFLSFAPEVLVPFTPRLVPAILPNLAHHVSMIQSAALKTNKSLFSVIQKLPSPQEPPPPKVPTEKIIAPARLPGSPTPPVKQMSVDVPQEAGTTPLNQPSGPRTRVSNADLTMTPRAGAPIEMPVASTSRPHSPVSYTSQAGARVDLTNSQPEELDAFDYQKTVNELTVQFLSEFEETRVAALKWLIMLHQKAPKKVLFLHKSVNIDH